MVDNKPIHIALIAGEKSGDLLGGPLIRQLKKKYPNAKFTGIGGDYMQEAGLQSIADINRLSIMGIFEVLAHLPDILKLEKLVLKYWSEQQPDIFIGIDAPDFNLRIARKLHEKGVKTVQYVSPSIWAWKEKRIEKIKKSIDLVLCLLPFETTIYDQHKVAADFVGHPARDRLVSINNESAKNSLNLLSDQNYIGILPGSRRSEIEKLLPLFLQTFIELNNANGSNLKALISVSDAKYHELINRLIEQSGLNTADYHLIEKNSTDLMASSTLLLLASGTITLEATLLEKPMLVAYKVHPITAAIVRRMLKIKYFSLPNLLAGKEIVHEWIQEFCTLDNLYQDADTLLNNRDVRNHQIAALKAVSAQLPFNVSEKAAQSIQKLIEAK